MGKNQDCYVAFLDIMGFADFVMGEPGIKVLSYLRQFMDFADTLNVKGLDLDVRIFSDCVIISTPAGGGFAEYHKFLLYVCNLQFAALTAGGLGLLPVRGSITKGQFYTDNAGLTFGHALVSAHGLENQIAVYPRVIISLEDYTPEKARESNLAVNALNWGMKVSHAEKASTVRRDFDGLLHLNYLSAVYATPDKWIPQGNQYVAAHKDFIAENIKKFQGNKRVSAKYEWMKNYHNWFCEGFKDLLI